MPTFKNLDEMQKYITKQFGNPKLKDLFTNKFIQKYTKFRTADEFFDNANIDLSKLDNNKALDAYIKSNTKFKNWEDFKSEAILLYAQSKGLPVTKGK